MSAQGLQRAANVLNVVGNLLPVIGEADAEGLDVARLLHGTLTRMGVPAPELVMAIVNIVQPAPPNEMPASGTPS